MAAGYEKFLDFDWGDSRWQSYLADLYPTPKHSQLSKWKKKWYKKNVDVEFDEAYEPVPAASGDTTSSSSTFNNFNASMYDDGDKWSKMGSQRASICLLAYTAALIMAIAASAGAFGAYQALLVLVGAFVLEILAKYGIKFKTEWLHNVLLDDVGVMPMMALTLLTPGLHNIVRLLALAPGFLTALLSFAQLIKAHRKLPHNIKDFFGPLAATSARFQIMQRRADVELLLGFVLIGAVFVVRAAPISALLYWNFMMMRYMMSPWTQASFRKIDDMLSATIGKVPFVNKAYAAGKRFLFSFVDPESKRAGSMCSIL